MLALDAWKWAPCLLSGHLNNIFPAPFHVFDLDKAARRAESLHMEQLVTPHRARHKFIKHAFVFVMFVFW